MRNKSYFKLRIMCFFFLLIYKVLVFQIEPELSKQQKKKKKKNCSEKTKKQQKKTKKWEGGISVGR